MLNDALDKPLLREGDSMTTIRDRHLARYGPFEWRQLESMPIHPQFGTVTAVTTKERYSLGILCPAATFAGEVVR
jgi:hypothetical protein